MKKYPQKIFTNWGHHHCCFANNSNDLGYFKIWCRYFSKFHVFNLFFWTYSTLMMFIIDWLIWSSSMWRSLLWFSFWFRSIKSNVDHFIECNFSYFFNRNFENHFDGNFDLCFELLSLSLSHVSFQKKTKKMLFSKMIIKIPLFFPLVFFAKIFPNWFSFCWKYFKV